METFVRNPIDGIYPADDYVHALEIRGCERTLYVSGTMGLDQDGIVGASIDEYFELIWNNLRTILSSADMSVDNIVRLTSYLRSGEYMQANAAARLKALNGRKIPTTVIIAETLHEDWLVEIEIIAAA